MMHNQQSNVKMKRFAFLFPLFILISSCHITAGKVRAVNSRGSGHFKVGSSYTIKGKTYHPQIYSHYEEVGVASWYGPECHNQLTANGEIFNRHLVTAAHKTLPLPSIVKVTNLENGKSLVIKVNDRGPFAHNRIIDLSEKAAKILGFHTQGTTKVKVQYMGDLSRQLIEKHPAYKQRYDKAVEKKRQEEVSQHNVTGYFAQFSSPQKAKKAASTLRKQGVKNVRIYFRNGKYQVKV